MALLSALLANKPVVLLDGAMGTELLRMGVDIELPLWSARALLSAPHVVRNIHFWYLHAGADVITTNTFRTNRRTLRKAGMESRWEELNLAAVQLAFEARERYRIVRPIAIAGSIAPVEECYAPDLVPEDAQLADEHGAQAALLAEMGVDLLLAETMNSIREGVCAARACAETGKEYAVGWVCGADGRLLSGESLSEAAAAILPYRPTAIFVNCVSAKHMLVPLTTLKDFAGLPFGCYANVGTPTIDGADIRPDVMDAEHVVAALAWLELGARVIGGCCGTTPEFIAAVAGRLRPSSLIDSCLDDDARQGSHLSEFSSHGFMTKE